MIDNAEHLVEAVAELTNELILRAPGIQIMVTSQAALRLPSERVFRLEHLAICLDTFRSLEFQRKVITA